MSEDQRTPEDPEPTHLDPADLKDGSDDTTREESAGQEDTLPGKRIGDFELLSELGRGGMGIVYEARQVSLNRRVALKVLPPGLGLTQQAVQRFEREAHAAAKLHHTGIVPVYATGEEAGCHYYAMELIEGQPLSEVLRDLTGQGSNPLMDETVTKLGGDAPAESKPDATTSQSSSGITSLSDSSTGSRKWFDAVAKLIAEVADALDYAHGRGVIHRDIKPANLMLSRDGRLCVTDFGLARVAQEPGMTVSGSLMGTPAYMSPEQIAVGRVKLDHRTDIYSLGAVLYELLAHRRPFPGESREEVLSGILTKDPRPPRRFNPRIPVDLETICQKAMEKDPDRRYQTAGDFANDLRQYLQRGLIAARRASLSRRAWKSIRRHPVTAVSVAAAIVILVLGGLAWRAIEVRASESARRAVADARLAMTTGDHAEALEKANAALEIDSELVDAQLIRTQALVKLDRTEEAVSEANALLAERPDDWRVHLILAGLAKGAETLEEVPTISAREHIEFVESRAPETADAYYLRSLIAETPGEALELLDRALGIDRGHAQALGERIRRHVELADFPAALQDCERLIAARPGSPQGIRAKSWVLQESGDRVGSLAEAEEAVRLDPEEPANYERRAWANSTLGRHEQTIEDFTRAIELNPDHSLYFEKRAWFFMQTGRFDEAVADARRSLEINPHHAGAYSALINAHLALNQREEAVRVISELSAAAEGWADTGIRSWSHGLIGEFRARLGDHEAALAETTRALEIQPDNLGALLSQVRIRRTLGDDAGAAADCDTAARIVMDPERGPRGGTAGWDVGNACGDWDLVLKIYDRLIERFPNWYAPPLGRCGINVYLGHLEPALTDCSRAIELSPRHFAGYQNRSAVFERMRRLDEALADAGKAVECHPYHPDLRYNYGWFLFSAGQVEAALAQIEDAIELWPENLTPHAERGRQLAYLGRCEEAVEAVNEAGRLAAAGATRNVAELGDLAESRLHAALFGCEAALDLEKTLDHARTAVEQLQGDPRYLTIYGFALYRDGQYDEASRSLTRAVETAGQESSNELFLLAMAAHRLGDHGAARSRFDRAVAWMEQYEPANPVLVHLRREAAELLGIDP